MENSDRFIAAYNRIDRYLRKRTGMTDRGKKSLSAMVDQASDNHRAIRQYADDLKELAEVRNAIVHDRRDTPMLAEPTDWAVERIEEIQRVLSSPPTIYPKYCSIEVHVLNPSQSLADAVVLMSQNDFSQIPVYDNGKFLGLLTTDSITMWLGRCAADDIFSLDETAVRDVLTAPDHENNVEFRARSATVFDALDCFESWLRCGKQLAGLLITDSGRPAEKLLGLMTVWDLAKVYGELGVH